MWLGLLFACSTNPLVDLQFPLDGVLDEVEACGDLVVVVRDPDHIARIVFVTPTDAAGASLVEAAGDDAAEASFDLPDDAVEAVLTLGTDLVGCEGGTDGDVDHTFGATSGALTLGVDVANGAVTAALSDATFGATATNGNPIPGPTLDQGAWSGPFTAE